MSCLHICFGIQYVLCVCNFLGLCRLEILFVRHVFRQCRLVNSTEPRNVCVGKSLVFFTVVFGRRRGVIRSSRVYNDCLAYVTQLHDYRTALKHPNVYQTLHVFYFYQVRYLVRKLRYFFLFWTNKLRFLAKLTHTVKSELKI